MINVVDVSVPGGTKTSQKQSYRLQKAIDIAFNACHRPGLVGAVHLDQSVFYPENQRLQINNYVLEQTIRVPGNVLLVGGPGGRRTTRLQWRGLSEGQACLHYEGGYGGGLQGLDIGPRPEQAQTENLVGILMESQSSSVFRDFNVNMTSSGKNSKGIFITQTSRYNTESVVFEKFNARGSQPVVIGAGDNVCFRDFDITCNNDVDESHVNAVFQNHNGYVPANLVIESGTGQKGDHAVHFSGDRERARGTGDSMLIQSFRWEQGSDTGPAWVFDVNRFAKERPSQRLHWLESLTMLNCRNSPMPSNSEYFSYVVRGVLNFTPIGGYLNGKKDSEGD